MLKCPIAGSIQRILDWTKLDKSGNITTLFHMFSTSAMNDRSEKEAPGEDDESGLAHESHRFLIRRGIAHS